jgi:hypothetical protein
MNGMIYIIYLFWVIQLFMQVCINSAYGFLHSNLEVRGNKFIKSRLHDNQYEHQNDWISGEVPWEFIELDNVLFNQDNNINIHFSTPHIHNTKNEFITDTTIANVEYTNGYTNIINTELEKNIIGKAIVSGAMKGVYVQLVSIDNMITYTQCYTNKVIDMDIVLSLMYFIIYEKIKNIEMDNIIILKKYNNIQLFEKYIKIRRNSMIVIIVMYVLLFRGIANVE